MDTTTPLVAWLTIEQAARRLDCSTRTIQRYIAAGSVDTRREGRNVRVSSLSLREIEAQR